ncbi:FAD/NAD(P)-binding domain-containing protein [Podospora didyma]|uniref:FAD/NAD(P)-binding domain-containing protein n=1 Tax=Podospora didyma TaxID=330526 RepID=A0AAE0NG16_9PEZI|nr:FAD/NAD(P)-binding domain-containing protein [Podospora didyma]
MDIIIVGAGIAGLAAGISLRRAGHRVTIYERSSTTNNEAGAAISVPPNVSRFLLPWGLDPTRARFVKPKGMYFVSFETNEPVLGRGMQIEHRQDVDLYGAPRYAAHRADLHAALKGLALGDEVSGTGEAEEARQTWKKVDVKLGMGVRSYEPETPSITLSNGTVVTADLVIAADGVNSTAAEFVLGHPQPSEIPAPPKANMCYRFLIPKVDIENDPATRGFNIPCEAEGTRIWVDAVGRKRLIAYLCRDWTMWNFVALLRDEEFAAEREDWLASVDKSEVLRKYSNFHPDLLAVINKATEVKRWPLLYRSPFPTWHKGRLVLAGDAAHPMLPHHAQGGAQAIEDGLAIGLVLHGATKASFDAEIEERLAVYEKIRRNRASAIQVMSNFGFDEKAPDELTEYLEGMPVPKTAMDMLNIAYSPDVLERTVKTMTEYDPEWKLPEGFFPGK